MALRLLAARRRTTAPGGSTGLPRVPRDGRPLVCSAEQRRIWLAELVAGPGAVPPVTAGLALDGPLDPDRLTTALAAVLSRHPVLRARFAARTGSAGRPDAEPWQTLPAEPPTAAETATVVETLDLTPFPEPEREDIARGMAVSAAGQPFDPATGRLLRLTVLSLAADRHRLLLACHHLAADGASLAVLLEELATAYRSGPHTVPPGPESPDYADYAQWSRDRLERVLPDRLAYWRHQLAGAPPRLLPDLAPPARPGRAEGRSTATAVARVDAATMQALRGAGRGVPLTAHTALLTGYLMLLARAARTAEATVGVVSGGRPHPELATVVGCFTDLLPLRVKLHGDPDFRTLAHRVRDALAAALTHAAPFDRIVSAVAPRRAPGVHPLFQALFVEREESARATMGGTGSGWGPGLASRPWGQEVDGTAYDLTLAATTGPGGAELVLTYPRDRFAPGAAGAFTAELADLLRLLADNPDAPMSRLRTPEAWRPAPVLDDALPGSRPAPTLDALDAQAAADAEDIVADAAQVLSRRIGTASASVIESVCALWAEVLGRPGIGPDDDLFALGGDSLAVVRIAARTEDRFGVAVPAGLFFETPTPAAFGAALARLVEEHHHG
ncbi:condensation domain-containing protein [Streptomyces sp. NPDC057798]|uniref:condensation domain-containing protein n=1 Tax=Streptomyces sp. NPDC057798 TaxID=3346252 RepID=UPI00369E5ED6